MLFRSLHCGNQVEQSAIIPLEETELLPEIESVPLEVGSVDFRGVNLDDGPIFGDGIVLLTITLTIAIIMTAVNRKGVIGGREDDVAESAISCAVPMIIQLA